MGMVCLTMLSNKEVIKQQQVEAIAFGHLMPAGSMLAAGRRDPGRYALTCQDDATQQ